VELKWENGIGEVICIGAAFGWLLGLDDGIMGWNGQSWSFFEFYFADRVFFLAKSRD
jgi:hypothetical protein